MAKAMIYPNIFKALIDGGFVTSEHHVQRQTGYQVHDKKGNRVGHMTDQAMQELLEAGVLVGTGQTVPEKGATVINYYSLPGRPWNILADAQLAGLGFRKNRSVCYAEDRENLLYEKSVQGGTDSFMLIFKNRRVLYQNLARHSVMMEPELARAVAAKCRELGWI